MCCYNLYVATTICGFHFLFLLYTDNLDLSIFIAKNFKTKYYKKLQIKECLCYYYVEKRQIGEKNGTRKDDKV